MPRESSSPFSSHLSLGFSPFFRASGNCLKTNSQMHCSIVGVSAISAPWLAVSIAMHQKPISLEVCKGDCNSASSLHNHRGGLPAPETDALKQQVPRVSIASMQVDRRNA